MLKSGTLSFLSCAVFLLFAEIAYAGSPVDTSFTSEPVGVDVVVRKNKSRKVIGTCVTPCALKLKTKRDFTVSFRKPEHSSLYTNKSKGVEQDGVLTFHAKLKSMEEIREEDRLKKELCAAKNLQPKGGEIDRNAKPLVKVMMKKPEQISGPAYCKLKFDVNIDSKIENIETVDCSHEALAEASKRVIPKWKYVNNQIDGCAIPKAGVETTITFD